MIIVIVIDLYKLENEQHNHQHFLHSIQSMGILQHAT